MSDVIKLQVLCSMFPTMWNVYNKTQKVDCFHLDAAFLSLIQVTENAAPRWTFPNVLACICEHAKIWAIFCFLFFRNVVKVTLFLHCLSLDVAPWSAPRRHAGSFSLRAPTFWKRARRPVQRPGLGEGARRPAGYYRVPKKLHQPDADTQRITGKETSPQNTTAA